MRMIIINVVSVMNPNNIETFLNLYFLPAIRKDIALNKKLNYH